MNFTNCFLNIIIRKNISVARETNLETQFKTEVNRLGCFYIKMPAMWLAGLPDRIFLLPNATVFFIEWKRPKSKSNPKGELRQIQVHIGNKLRGLGFRVYVVDSLKEARKIFRDEYQASIE